MCDRWPSGTTPVKTWIEWLPAPPLAVSGQCGAVSVSCVGRGTHKQITEASAASPSGCHRHAAVAAASSMAAGSTLTEHVH